MQMKVTIIVEGPRRCGKKFLLEEIRRTLRQVYPNLVWCDGTMQWNGVPTKMAHIEIPFDMQLPTTETQLKGN